ncbi:RidA family protein, partial [Escherichia coli]|nr:RidA family protein [Escherichia coli]
MVERTAVFLAGRHSLYAESRYSASIRSGDL